MLNALKIQVFLHPPLALFNGVWGTCCLNYFKQYLIVLEHANCRKEPVKRRVTIKLSNIKNVKYCYKSFSVHRFLANNVMWLTPVIFLVQSS